ncbi:MAG: T9SS type A sorting domain-containing protein [Sphingobacteriales bacterium]|nr:MAG: T9SS type A sorting domain-containing protein [Sphingobacteriales bacterium]
MKSNVYAPVKAACLFMLLILCNTLTVSAQQYLTKIDSWNAYVHLPDDYNDGSNRTYPLICFIPGLGEIGTDPSKMLTYGPSKFVAEGHPMTFMVNGKLEKPIVISIQPTGAWPNAYTINKKLDSIMARFRCDASRINVTGLSMGGWSWTNLVDGYNTVYTNRVTSVVAMSAPEPDNYISNMRLYAQAGGKWWGFEGSTDYRKMDMLRDTMNRYKAGSARYTPYVGGHCCWNTWYNPSWTENGESIYTFMLKQKKTVTEPPVASPQAIAGNDSSLATTSSSFALRGAGNDPVGLPINFAWTKLSGPAAGTIANAASAQTSITGLASGTYQYELRVTNALGAIGRDTITFNNGNLVLPVKLASFTATPLNGEVIVQWKTDIEYNSAYFVVEKTSDARHFSPMVEMPAEGNNGNGSRYSSTDKEAITGMNYYRLKIVDKDGSAAYSTVIAASLSKVKTAGAQIATVHSNGATLKMNVTSATSQPVSLVVTDAAGRKVMATNLTLVKGANAMNLPLVLQRGVYYARIVTGTTTSETISFIRQ